jgi:hypothetical protein
LVRQLGPDEHEAIRQDKKAIVLYRLTGSLDSKELHLLVQNLTAGYFKRILLRFGLANLDTGEPINNFSPLVRSGLHFSPSPEVAKRGWGAFMLEPGTYYLRVTSDGADRSEIIDPIPEFRFIVPPNTPLLYIGSLHLACTTKKSASWFGGREFESCSSQATAADETEAARVVAEASFKDFGSPSSMIMQPYGTPLPPGTISKVAPVGLLVPSGKIDLGSPEWMRRAIILGLAPSGGLLALGLAIGPAGALPVMGAILWAPVGAAFGYLGGKWSESSWDSCRQALQESLSKFDPMAALATKLKAAIDNWGIPTLDIAADAGARAEASDVKSILNAQIQRIVVRLCRSSSLSTTLCLEVVTRARLFEAARQIYLADKVFVYSDAELSTLKLQPYELFVTWSTTPSSGRDLDAYCGEGGGEILQGDLSEALDATVYRVAQDLGLRLE